MASDEHDDFALDVLGVGVRYAGDLGTLDILHDEAGQRCYWLNGERIDRDKAQRFVDEWHRRRTPTV
jgi:hypothetical protein